MKQHKNDPILTKTSIQNIVWYCFGDYEKCDEEWCSRKFEASYKQKSLMQGKDLCRKELKKDLNRVF